jgi:hypothetical protein
MRRLVGLLLLTTLPLLSAAATEPTAKTGPDTEVLELAGIRIDKGARRFSVTGRVVKLEGADAPVEFLLAARHSIKLYESLLELDTDAVNFNVACILIGLDPKRGRPARHHFDPQPVAGDAVAIDVSWQHDGKRVQVPISRLVRTGAGNAIVDDWVYTGSMFAGDGQFMARAHGVLAGLVHAPETLIEHRSGVGLGDYGAVMADPAQLPPAGTEIRVEIRALVD